MALRRVKWAAEPLPQLLGLEKPWHVDRVELDVKQQRVDVFAKYD